MVGGGLIALAMASAGHAHADVYGSQGDHNAVVRRALGDAEVVRELSRRLSLGLDRRHDGGMVSQARQVVDVEYRSLAQVDGLLSHDGP